MRDSADASGPLKSVSGGLHFIPKNCKVYRSPHPLSPTLTGGPADGCESTYDRAVGTQGQRPLLLHSSHLFLRVISWSVKGERDGNSKPTFSKVRSRARLTGIVRKLETVLQELGPLADQGKVEGFFNNAKNAD